MSDETPVERRLRQLAVEHSEDQFWNAADCGREAIRLLRDMMAESGDPFKWEDDARILLARCTEGPR